MGRVLAADGRVAAGLLVKISDREQKFTQRLGQRFTDGQGAFFFGYHGEEFPDLFEADPMLFLMVTDASGKALFTSKDAFHTELGRVERFEIHLSASVPPPATRGERQPRRRRAR
jgi:hypothetical protein